MNQKALAIVAIFFAVMLFGSTKAVYPTIPDLANAAPSSTKSNTLASGQILTIPVGQYPNAIAFDSANHDLYVANSKDSTVSVISDKNNKVVGKPIHVGESPDALAVDSANGDIYVTGAFGFVSVISGKNNTVIGSPISLKYGSAGIAFDSGNDNLYATTNYNNRGNVSVISDKNNTVIGKPIPLGGGVPRGIAFDSGNGNLYVANSDNNTVSVISDKNNTVIGKPIPVGRFPDSIAFDSDNVICT